MPKISDRKATARRAVLCSSYGKLFCAFGRKFILSTPRRSNFLKNVGPSLRREHKIMSVVDYLEPNRWHMQDQT